MVPVAPISGFQKELICLRPFQGKRLREYISLESIIDLGHGNLPQKTQTPRAQPRLEAQVTREPKANIGPKVPDTNEKGPNKGWVPKSV